MTDTLKNIIEELETQYNKKLLLYGHHKSTFAGVPPGYTLKFSECDKEYPESIAKTDYITNHFGYGY